MAASLYWYDFETFGADPRRDRAAQFAGLRTDPDLQEVDEPLVLYCRPSPDFLPSAMSCLITGITPQVALARGIPEAEFIQQIHAEFATRETCVVGYNNLRFDDELTRQLLYRNFIDPYEREYKSGNSRWDIIDMLRLCAALRPDGIEWPRNPDGTVSFRLELLTAANGIPHGEAHDALADVRATIALARLVRQHQPRLYDYVFQLRAKARVEAQLQLDAQTPVLHVSSRYPGRHGNLALVIPVCRHPSDGNGVIVYDLRQDPALWLSLSPEALQRRVFSASADLGEDEPRIGLKVIHINRCPIVAPATMLTPELAVRYDVDLAACEVHRQRLLAVSDLRARVARVFAPTERPVERDPDFMIYSGGFLSDADRRQLTTVRNTAPAQLANLQPNFRDPRLPEMLFRYRARNWPQTLSADEHQRWQAFCAARLAEPAVRAAFARDWAEAQARGGERLTEILAALSDYVAQLPGGMPA